MTRRIALAAALAAFAPLALAAPDAVPGELLVGWREGRGASEVHGQARAALVRRDDRLRLDHVRLPAGASLESALRRYRRDPAVRFAEPNFLVRKAAVVPDDPLYSQQWALPAIAAPDAWAIATTSAVTVAIVDTGIRLDHPDLAPNLWTGEAPGDANGDGCPGACGVDDDGDGRVDEDAGGRVSGDPGWAPDPDDDDEDGIADDVHGASFRTYAGVPHLTGDPMDDDVAESHGTHVAGIVGAAGSSGAGITGVAWGVRLLAVKVLHGSEGLGTLADLVAGIGYALDHGARVVNLSVEIPEYSATLADAIADADLRGALVVSAAGNSRVTVGDPTLPPGAGSLVSPASIRTPNAIAVAAVGPGDVPAWYSSRGALTVDVAAPGGDALSGPGAILSTVARCPDADRDGTCDGGAMATPAYGDLAGTSMAAPHVAGLAALVWATRPGLTHHKVKARILNGVTPVAALADWTITGGRIDAAAALALPDELPAVFKVIPCTPDPESTVSVLGTNFGGAPGTVTVDGVPLVVVSWSDEHIVATLPPGAGAGRVQVNGTGTSFPLLVGGFPPVVTLSASPTSGAAPLRVAFAAYASDLDGTVVRWEWDFGSGLQEYAGIEDSAVVTFNAGGAYDVRVRVTDDRGLTALATVRVDAAAPPPSDSRCFVATAAFGSPGAAQVRALRAFRDRHLLPSGAGRALVGAYYRISPPLADAIRERPALRAAARALLAPVVLCVEEPVALPSLAALGLAALAWRRRPRYQGTGR